MQKFTIRRYHPSLSHYDLDECFGALTYCDELNYELSNDEKKKNYLKKNHNYYLGVLNESGCGIELTIIEDQYEVSVSGLSTLHDWKYAIELVRNLAIKNNSTIVDENFDVYDEDSILEYDYYLNMEEGLDILYKNLTENKVDNMYVYGINYTQFIDKKIVLEWYESDDLLINFTNYIVEKQWIDCGIVEQKLLKDDISGEIHSFYAIYANVDLILPIKPVVDINYLTRGIKFEDVKSFELLLLDEDANVIAEIKHEQLEDVLPKDKYRKIDAINIVINSLSVNELIQLHLDVVKKYGDNNE